MREHFFILTKKKQCLVSKKLALAENYIFFLFLWPLNKNSLLFIVVFVYRYLRNKCLATKNHRFGLKRRTFPFDIQFHVRFCWKVTRQREKNVKQTVIGRNVSERATTKKCSVNDKCCSSKSLTSCACEQRPKLAQQKTHRNKNHFNVGYYLNGAERKNV